MEILSEKVSYDGVDLFPLPLDVALANKVLLTFEFYLISQNHKIFKIDSGNEQIEVMLKRYKRKGIFNIFLTEENHKLFLENIKKQLSNKFFNPSSRNESKNNIITLNNAYKLVREKLSQLGFSKKSLQLAQDLNRDSLMIIRKSPGLFDLFKKFKDSCEEGFLDSLYTSFISTCIINKSSWKSETILENISLASILCDITLTPVEYLEVEGYIDHKLKDIPSSLKNHPIQIAQIIAKNLPDTASEVIQCIKLHHELPDGSGFPRKLEFMSIGQLPSVLIISQYATRELKRIDFKYENKDRVVNLLRDSFDTAIFKSHLNTLVNIIDKEV